MLEQPLPPVTSFTLDQSRLDAMIGNTKASFRDWMEDSSKSVDISIDLNKQVFAFYERLLLLNTGTVGVSVSALLSFGSRAGALGHTKYPIVVLVTMAWLFLLLSITLCRLVMMHTMIANRKLYQEWRKFSGELNGSMMSGDIARIATTMKGTIEIDGKPVDTSAHFNKVAEMMKQKFAESNAAIVAQQSKVDLGSSGELGKRAILYMQLALVLLGVAAVTLLVRL